MNLKTQRKDYDRTLRKKNMIKEIVCKTQNRNPELYFLDNFTRHKLLCDVI